MPVNQITAVSDVQAGAIEPHAAWQHVVQQIADLIGVDDGQPELLDAIHKAIAELPGGEWARAEDNAAGVRGEPVQERRKDLNRSQPRHPFEWSSPTAEDLLLQIQRVAAVDSTAMLIGESGTGKSMLARMIHERSQRRNAPFVAVNCASLPRELIDAELFGHTRGAFTGASENRHGKVEAAQGGTLFLDEIADLPLELQPKLLTFLQDKSFYRIGSNQLRHVDVRVISATHSDPAVLVAAKKFRQDLFFRLAVLRIDVPPLRQRAQEIRPLAQQLLNRLTRQYGLPPRTLSESALQLLETYHWPGNFRELENTLESAVAFCRTSVIAPADLQLPFGSQPSPADGDTSSLGKSTLAELERQAIVRTLRPIKATKPRRLETWVSVSAASTTKCSATASS